MFPCEFTPLCLWRYWYWYMNVQKCYTIEELECIPPNCNNAIQLLWLFIYTHCLSCPVGGLYVVHTDMFICVQFSGSGIIQHVSGWVPVGLLDPGAASCSALTWGNSASGKHGGHRGQHRPRRYLTTGQTASWLPPGKEDCRARQATQSLSVLFSPNMNYLLKSLHMLRSTLEFKISRLLSKMLYDVL